MRFIVVHKVTSYLMVATGLGALVTSEQLHPVVSALALVGLVASWWWEPPRVDLGRFETAWNVATLLMLARTGFDILTDGPLILSGVYFIVFLSVNKLFNRRTSRDYQQLYVLSFLHMVAGTALNTDLAYGALFLAYIVFCSWTLILFHLKREMEENYLLKYGDSLQGRPVQVQRVLNSRKLVGGPFLVATSAVSVVVFAGSAALFFLFPRVGFGFFMSQHRAGITMAGFSDKVELGRFGRIKDDRTVVMRVEFEGGQPDGRLPRYWRGISLDHYDGTTWTKTSEGARYLGGGEGPVPINPHHATLADDAVQQHIYLEPMDANVLFGLSRLTHIALQPRPGPDYFKKRRGLRIDVDGDVHYRQQDELAFRYTAFSEPETATAGLTRTPLTEYRQRLQRYMRQTRGRYRYLQLPALDPKVAALARQIVGDAKTVAEAVQRIEDHLRSQYSYTLDLKRDARYAPLEDFLFVQKRGHCEYFATAMVVLLRSVGIAARNVNGFLGGTWNEYGRYLAVSQGDAHSWVEVFAGIDAEHPRGAWLTRDPTPSGGSRPRVADAWSKVLQYTDAIRLRWYKYVIEYDLQKQVGALYSARAWWGRTFGRSEAGEERASANTTDGRTIAAAIVGLALLVGVVLVVRRRRVSGGSREDRARRQSATVAALYQLLTDGYARLGFARSPATTASEFVRQLERRSAPDLDLARAVVRLYEAVRFGGAELPPDELSALQARIKRLGRPS